MLPGMSGYAVCEALRAIDRDMPVLILSARTLAEDRTRGFDVGREPVHDQAVRPGRVPQPGEEPAGLFPAARPRTGPPRRQVASTQFEFAGAKIDFETFEVLVNGEPVRMTQLEMTLLRYFVENEGRVIPRRELLENVWGMPGSINTRAPDQFIRRLRKIFEPDPAQPRHFLTIRDAGYRFLPRGKAPKLRSESVPEGAASSCCTRHLLFARPGGSLENSPAIYRWVWKAEA